MSKSFEDLEVWRRSRDARRLLPSKAATMLDEAEQLSKMLYRLAQSQQAKRP
jgi:hypothetical protein